MTLVKVVEAFVLGLVIGAIFGLTRLDVPAPPSVAGVAGIFGITIGWLLLRRRA